MSLKYVRLDHIAWTIQTSCDIIHWYDEAIHKIRNQDGQYTYEKVLHHYNQKIVNKRLFWAIRLAEIKKMD